MRHKHSCGKSHSRFLMIPSHRHAHCQAALCVLGSPPNATVHALGLTNRSEWFWRSPSSTGSRRTGCGAQRARCAVSIRAVHICSAHMRCTAAVLHARAQTRASMTACNAGHGRARLGCGAQQGASGTRDAAAQQTHAGTHVLAAMENAELALLVGDGGPQEPSNSLQMCV